METLVVAIIGTLVIGQAAIWHRLGRVEGRIEQVLNGQRKEER